MSNKYILVVDQGTTRTKATIFDHSGNVISHAYREIKNVFPNPGWVECDAMKIWISVVDVITESLIMASLTINDIDSIGIANQRETTVVWNKKTGKPVYNAIIWQSKQTVEICNKVKKYEKEIFKRTGLYVNPYFSASKIRWILDHVKNGQKRALKGELVAGTIDSWIIYKLTKHQVFATDYSNASRTLLFNINTLKWDDYLLKLFNIPKKMLPKVCDSSYDYGKISYFSDHVHITGVAGDQQASLFGQRCFKKGQYKTTYGTGAFVLTNVGNKVVYSKNKLLTTIAWKIGKQVTYCLEGSVFICGGLFTWLKRDLKLIDNETQVQKLATQVKDSNGVYIVPAFTGLGAPYWDNEAKGAIYGLSIGTNKKHIIRAAIESMAYQVKDVVDTLKKDTKLDSKVMRVDGGVCRNEILLQFQADILRTKIKLPKSEETTGLGACYLAGLKSGYFKNINQISHIPMVGKEFSPKMPINVVKTKCDNWKTAIEAIQRFKMK